MDDATVITETDYQKYVICQKKLATEALVATPKLNSIANVLNLSRERHNIKIPLQSSLYSVQRTKQP